MKYKKIIFLFAIFMPVSVLLRLIQFSFTIDYSTGFYIKEFEVNGEAMFWVILGLCFAPAVFALFSHRSPEHPPKPTLTISIASFLAAASVIFEMMFEEFSAAVMGWQILAVKLVGIASAVFFIFFGAQRFINFSLPRIFTALPTVYFILRTICDFTSISSLALISENLLLMLSYCAVLIFMLQFTKLYNGLDSERGFRKLLSSGLLSISLCATSTIPHFVFKIITGYSFMHTSVAANVNLFFIGLFIAVFIFSHFSFSNSCTEAKTHTSTLAEKFTNIWKKFK